MDRRITFYFRENPKNKEQRWSRKVEGVVLAVGQGKDSFSFFFFYNDFDDGEL